MKRSITKEEAIAYIKESIAKLTKKDFNLQLELKIISAIGVFEDIGLLTFDEARDLSDLKEDTRDQRIRIIKGKFEGEEGVLDVLSFKGPGSRSRAKVNLDYSGRVDVGWGCLEYFKEGKWTPNF